MAREVDDETDYHPHARCPEAVVPAVDLPQRAAHEGGEERPEVYAKIEYAEGAVAPGVPLPVKPAHLRGYVRLERPVSEDEKEQGRKEQALDRHREMADGHEDRADDYRAALPQEPVGHNAAEEGRKVDESRVKPVNLRGMGLIEEKMPRHNSRREGLSCRNRRTFPTSP